MSRTLVPIILVAVGLALPASADETFFSMSRLQAESKLFGRISAQSQGEQERVQREVVTTGKALDGFGDSLVAAQLRTGDRPAAASERHGALAARFDLDWQALNTFVDGVVTDTDRAFVESLQRQVAVLEEREGITLGACEPPQGVLGMVMGESDCAGTDYTDHLVALLDEDPALVAAVEDVVSRPWPAMRPEREPMGALSLAEGIPLDGEPSWIDLGSVVRKGDGLDVMLLAIEGAYRESGREVARAQEAMAINIALAEAGDESLAAEIEAQRAEVTRASEVLTGWRERASGEAMALIWELAAGQAGPLAKELGADEIGVCLQPRDLGACRGVDVSAEVASFLASQKKAVKAAEKHADGVVLPALGL